MKRLDAKGFSALELLLIVVVIALLAGAGVYYFRNHKKDDSKPVATNTPTAKENSPVADPTADWVTYTSTPGKYSLKYPKTWVTATHPELCTEGIFLVAPIASSVGACGSESFGQTAFIAVGENSHICYPFAAPLYKDITKTTVTVSGYNFTKQSGVIADDSSGNGITLQKGTQNVNYCYDGGNWGFSAQYNQKPSDTNVLADFNTIVTKTLKINR